MSQPRTEQRQTNRIKFVIVLESEKSTNRACYVEYIIDIVILLNTDTHQLSAHRQETLVQATNRVFCCH